MVMLCSLGMSSNTHHSLSEALVPCQALSHHFGLSIERFGHDEHDDVVETDDVESPQQPSSSSTPQALRQSGHPRLGLGIPSAYHTLRQMVLAVRRRPQCRWEPADIWLRALLGVGRDRKEPLGAREVEHFGQRELRHVVADPHQQRRLRTATGPVLAWSSSAPDGVARIHPGYLKASANHAGRRGGKGEEEGDEDSSGKQGEDQKKKKKKVTQQPFAVCGLRTH